MPTMSVIQNDFFFTTFIPSLHQDTARDLRELLEQFVFQYSA